MLRQPLVADQDQPAFDRSAMDGYAIAAGDPATEFRVVSTIQPGGLPDVALCPGQAARIFTGAALPEGADRVIPQELVEHVDGCVRIAKRPKPSFVRRRGEDARLGDTLLATGTLLGPGELAILATAGEVWPMVTRRPRVFHVSSGNEVVGPEQLPMPGQIRDSNAILVRSLVGQAGGEIVAQTRVRDTPEAALHGAKLLEPSSFDMLLFSGGASVGDYDYAAATLRELGFLAHFQQVDVRPGKPLLFATRGHQLAFGIPGNPVSHFAVFHRFILPALRVMQGFGCEGDALLPGMLSEELKDAANSRETYWPARWRWSAAGGAAEIEALPWNSSGHTASLARANALLRVPANTGSIPQDAAVQWLKTS